MQPLIWERRPDGLRAPALVCAFKGWNDAGDAASAALQFVGASLGAERFATLDPEDFFDFQATRPSVRITDGATREITWPSVEIFEAKVPRAPRDLVLVGGPEPSMRWRTFCTSITDLADALGSMMSDVPHTRPISVFAGSDSELVRTTLDLERSTYEGPVGILSVLSHAADAAGIPSASLWASVPHYVAGHTPSPKATLALLDRLEDLTGAPVARGELATESAAWEASIDAAAADDEEMTEYIRQLERTRDTWDSPEASGDAIAQEFEKYLRRGGGPGSGDGPTKPGRDEPRR